jgi:maltooligosyltrehalose trehalohydrolase
MRLPQVGGLEIGGHVHHSVDTLLTADRNGYYADFGSVEHLARALRDGYTYTGQYSEFRERGHGAPPSGIPPERHLDSTDERWDGPGGQGPDSLAPGDEVKVPLAASSFVLYLRGPAHA